MAAVLAIASCGENRESDATDPAATTGISTTEVIATAAATESSTTTPTSSTSAPVAVSTTTDVNQPLGELVTGNRVILIGDSVLASTASRFWGGMCSALVPLGWQAEVDAEPLSYIDFALTVLDRRLDAGWDAAVIFLGNNYEGDESNFASQLDTVLQRLAPRLTLLLTVSEPGFTSAVAEVNEIIRQTSLLYNNVRVVDWASVTAADPGLLKDRVHLRASGREALTMLIAAQLGPAPELPGDCLETEFDFMG